MTRYRLYPSKDTTIIEGNHYNTGLNQVGELWYGDEGITRHLMYFDISKITDGTIPEDVEFDCTLLINNCYEIYETAKQANSVDVEICEVTTEWDEGNKFNFNSNEKVGFANWYSATSISSWTDHGGDYYTDPEFSFHIDRGDEDIVGDVTDMVSGWTTGASNNGIILKYEDTYEDLEENDQQIYKFYTKDTNTYKLPYIEFNWDGQIQDDRNFIVPGSTKRLYLYTKQNNEYKNAFEISKVVVSFNNDETPVTSITINNQYSGVYYIDFECPTGVETFHDSWYITYEDGLSEAIVSKSGTCIESDWETDDIAFDRYIINIPNLKQQYDNETERFIEVNAIKEYTNTIVPLKELQYRIDLMDGENRYEMIDWEDVSYTNSQNVIFLDTTWFISDNKYTISFRTRSSSKIKLLDFISRRSFWVKNK